MQAILCIVAGFAIGSCAPAPWTPVVERDGAFDLASEANRPALKVLRAGGLSGIVFDRAGELLAISDDHVGPRVLTLRVHENPFRLEPTGMISLWGSPEEVDPEGIAILENGNLLVASEGNQDEEPRTAPGILEFTHDGQWVRTLALRNKFVPTPQGPITVGVRGNSSFESLTLTFDRTRLFTAVETALAQDGEPANFDRGTRARILEYVRQGETFAPAREWVYETDPVARPDFPAGFFINGLVELLALDDEHLLALERSYAEEANEGARSLQRIRIYQVSLRGATDVSNLDSIANRSAVRPVTKQLVLDLGESPNLPPGLSGLDNFEGLAYAPPGADRRRRLLMVSDDNFDETQRTWFLRLTY